MTDYTGKLIIDRNTGDEWGYLIVDDKIRQKYYDLLGLKKWGYEISDFDAHISVFTDE